MDNSLVDKGYQDILKAFLSNPGNRSHYFDLAWEITFLGILI